MGTVATNRKSALKADAEDSSGHFEALFYEQKVFLLATNTL
jgi:hypothetical protein